MKILGLALKFLELYCKVKQISSYAGATSLCPFLQQCSSEGVGLSAWGGIHVFDSGDSFARKAGYCGEKPELLIDRPASPCP